MSHPITYPYKKIGTLTRPTPEERAREGDRWVSLRTLHTASAVSSAPASSADTAPAPQSRALFRAVEARHAQARRMLDSHSL